MARGERGGSGSLSLPPVDPGMGLFVEPSRDPSVTTSIKASPWPRPARVCPGSVQGFRHETGAPQKEKQQERGRDVFSGKGKKLLARHMAAGRSESECSNWMSGDLIVCLRTQCVFQ